MVSKAKLERRERLAYLALRYAIQGNEEQSEQVRRLVRQLESRDSRNETPVLEPVGA